MNTGISETKKRIVLDNYFKRECDINTTIREAYEKGFELGLQKAPKSRMTGKWIREFSSEADFIRGQYSYKCPFCGKYGGGNYCSECGAKMEGEA